MWTRRRNWSISFESVVMPGAGSTVSEDIAATFWNAVPCPKVESN